MFTLTIPFVALLAAVSLTAGATVPDSTGPSLHPIPVGVADGFYQGYVHENGSTVWEFLGADAASVNPTNATVSSATAATAPESNSTLAKRDFVTCNGFGITANDANNAQNDLANMCGSGYFFSSKSVARVSGGAVAYGCNYGNGQTCHSDDVQNFFGQINAQCGFTQGSSAGAGYYEATSWKAAYGRTSQGSGFC